MSDSPEADGPAAPAGAEDRILVVDDDPMTRMLIRNVLSKNGFQIEEADSAEAALEAIEASGPDLILLDVLMDGMDGFDACDRIKALPGMAEVPIIFLTARSESKAIVKGFQAGGSDYITKPFKPFEALARIRTHLQIRHLILAQRENLAALEKANQAKNKLMSVVSHDLKNPIGAVRGLAEFLQDGSFGALSEEQCEMVRSIHAAADAMFGLVEDLLDMSLLEDDAISLNFQPCDFRSIVVDAMNLHKVSAEKKEITIEFTEQPLAERTVCDRRQARRVLDNLLTNAVKFSPRGTGVHVSLDTHEGGFCLSVRDQGPGVPEGEHDKLFKHLGKTSNKPTGGEQSTGLGLAICKKIVEAHGGQIGFENLAGRGARFYATFPYQPPSGFYVKDAEVNAAYTTAGAGADAPDRAPTRAPLPDNGSAGGPGPQAAQEKV